MGLRGPKPKVTPEERLERKRAWHWTHRGLPVPPRGLLRNPKGSPHRKPKRHLPSERAHKQVRIARAKAFVLAYKQTHSCIDCGYADPRALTFDHRDRMQKKFCIGERWGGASISMKKLQTEIEKCDIRCANCHMIRTKAEKHWREIEDWERPVPASGDIGPRLSVVCVHSADKETAAR